VLAVNVKLPAFAAERRHACSTAPVVSIDISYQQGAQQQTHRPLLLLSINGADRWTDTRPFHRAYSAYNVGRVSKREHLNSECVELTVDVKV